ncbi:MAG: FtsX-like permease family protein [Polyangiales bacterium]
MRALARVRLGLGMLRGARARWLWALCAIAVGVTAVVGVEALDHALEAGLRHNARALLGGDLAVESRRALPDLTPYLPAETRDAPRVKMTILSTMVRTATGASRLAEVKAIDTPSLYPLAGVLETEPAAPLATLLGDDGALLAPELMQTLGLAVGDPLDVGNVRLRVAGALRKEPDPLAFSLQLGPRVLISERALQQSGLLGMGSRVRSRVVLAVPERALAPTQASLRAHLPGADAYVTVETHVEGQPMLRRTLERVRSYLSLLALACLLIAAVGVAHATAAWLEEARDDTAVLRCLGFRARDLFALYIGQLAGVALLGSMLGALAGTSMPALLGWLAPEVAPFALLPTFSLAALGRGVAVGIGVPCVLALGPLSSVFAVSPARVLRADAEPLAVPRGLVAALVTLAAVVLFATAWLACGDARVAGAFVLAVAGLALVARLAAEGLIRAVGGLTRVRFSPLLSHGLAALARPSAGTRGGIVALALGGMLVLSIALLDEVLGRALATALPEGAPSVFLMDVQPDQWAETEAVARALGASRVESVPVTMARLSAVDGRDIPSLLRARSSDPSTRQRDHWMLTREQRITWSARLPDDNRLVEGSLWPDPNVAEVSVEEGFARELGARVGSVLRFDVQGVPIDLTVCSLRTVAWRSFAPNFFLVAEPGVLDDAPHALLGMLRLPPSREQALQDRLAATLPNVNALRVRTLLDRARATLAQLSAGVRILGGFAIVSGLLVLTGAVAAAEARRAREAALWKALGLTRLRVALLFAIEYAVSGAAAGLLGAIGGYLACTAVAREVLALREAPSVVACLLAVLATSLLATVAGLLASLRALRVRPIEVLRG